MDITTEEEEEEDRPHMIGMVNQVLTILHLAQQMPVVDLVVPEVLVVPHQVAYLVPYPGAGVEEAMMAQMRVVEMAEMVKLEFCFILIVTVYLILQ